MSLRDARPGIQSALAESDEGASYDRRAALYDRVIGNRLYNRIIWNTNSEDYSGFAAEALASGDGPLLDAGCGTAVFTGPIYKTAARPLTLVDRSLHMLEKARERVGDATLVQADINELPFAPGGFEAIGCFAMLHVLDDPWRALAALRDQLTPGGRLFASMLVADGKPVGRAYIRALKRAGEVGALRTSDELRQAADALYDDVDVRQTGSMAWLRATRRG